MRLFAHLFLFFLLSIRVLDAQEIELGDWKVWSLSDGYLDLDQKMFVDVDPAFLHSELIRAGVDFVGDLVVRTEVYGFLVDTGNQLILVDTGCGRFGPASTGHLIQQLRQIGHEASDISIILLTHLHPDHVGGLLTQEGAPAFPNATVYISATEATFWRDPKEASMADDEYRPVFAIAHAALTPYEQKGRLFLFQPDVTLLPGVTAINACGHTPGHTAYLFCSQGKQLLLWGDIVHSYGVQFSHPQWHVKYDSDGGQAVASRECLFAFAADEFVLVGGAHLPQPGFGRVARAGTAFIWTPF